MSGQLGGNSDLAGVKLLAQMAYRDAEVMTISDTQVIMAAIFIGGLLFIPLLRKPRAAGGGEAH